MGRSEDTVPVKTVRAPMPRSRRAKQFQPFNALKGLYEAIAEKEKTSSPRRYLGEDRIAEIDQTLQELERGQLVTTVYYSEEERNYLFLTGPVAKIDPVWRILYIRDTGISFEDILDLIPIGE